MSPHVEARISDEAVTHARNAVSAKKAVGDPSWVNPVLYWRCEDSRAFDVHPLIGGKLPPEVAQQLNIIDGQLAVYQKTLDTAQPANIQVAVAELRKGLQNKVEELLAVSNVLLGNGIRLWGGSASVGQLLRCKLTIRVRMPTIVKRLRLHIVADENSFELKRVSKGADSASNPLSHANDGSLTLLVEDVSGGATWKDRDYELVLIDYEVKSAALATQRLDVNIDAVETDPAIDIRPVPGIAFLANA
jgi:hypothetical protein